MYLFINAVSQDWVLILFNDKREIISQEEISILWNESSKFISILEDFIEKNSIEFSDIKNYIVVSWPGSFTWLRTIVLTVNTLAYIYGNSITDVNYFDLFSNYPIVKTSSKRDVFVKYEESDIIHIETNEALSFHCKETWYSVIYWDIQIDRLWNSKYTLSSSIDYKKIIINIELLSKNIIEPLYIKKPNIS